MPKNDWVLQLRGSIQSNFGSFSKYFYIVKMSKDYVWVKFNDSKLVILTILQFQNEVNEDLLISVFANRLHYCCKHGFDLYFR